MTRVSQWACVNLLGINTHAFEGSATSQPEPAASTGPFPISIWDVLQALHCIGLIAELTVLVLLDYSLAGWQVVVVSSAFGSIGFR